MCVGEAPGFVFCGMLSNKCGKFVQDGKSHVVIPLCLPQTHPGAQSYILPCAHVEKKEQHTQNSFSSLHVRNVGFFCTGKEDEEKTVKIQQNLLWQINIKMNKTVMLMFINAQG